MDTVISRIQLAISKTRPPPPFPRPGYNEREVECFSTPIKNLRCSGYDEARRQKVKLV